MGHTGCFDEFPAKDDLHLYILVFDLVFVKV